MSTPTGAFKYIHTCINKHKHTCLGTKHRPKHTRPSVNSCPACTNATRTHYPHKHIHPGTWSSCSHVTHQYTHIRAQTPLRHQTYQTHRKMHKRPTELTPPHTPIHFLPTLCIYCMAISRHSQRSRRAWLCLPSAQSSSGRSGSSIP